MKRDGVQIDKRSLVETASELVNISSPTGDEQAMAEHMARVFHDMDLHVQWQEVEEGRPNVLGTWRGTGGGKTLMFNGHMDTSYSGREPWLAGRGFRPEARVEGDYLYGLGISNMKGSLACYIEAVRALQAEGVRLQGDVLIAAVVGEIEKTQWGDEFRGKEYRGYAAGSRHLVTHGGVADMCVLGEPTEQRIVLGHYGSIWMRLSTKGPFMHTAFSGGRSEENSIVRMRDVLGAVLEWIPDWQARTSYGGKPGIVNVGSVRGGFPWRVSRTPGRTDLFLDVRVPPTMPMAEARAALADWVRELQGRFPDYGLDWEIYVSAPGAEIAEDHELVRAIDVSHTEVYGSAPDRDTVRWFSDASVLTRYGIATVNYGTSSGLPGADGENLEIRGLVDTARVYALTAQRVCGTA
ncbi:MAG TPA: M20/M25/M40 family metallo-hydrolase [Gaiellaceae bacterium]|jgi:acetylornithine deacetylase